MKHLPREGPPGSPVARIRHCENDDRYDGPWDLEENLEQHKLYLGYDRELGAGHARFTVQGYDSEWVATDQIPARAVASGSIDELGYIDPDLGGQTERYAVTAALEYPGWRGTAYLIDYDFTLFSNFTYELIDPLAGDEFEQRDRRTIWGLSVDGATDLAAGRPATLRWGADVRYDDIDEVGLYGTTARQRDQVIRQDAVKEWSVGAFAEAEFEVTERLRAALGIRADYYDWDVDAYRPVNGGSGGDHLVSPTFNLAYRFNDRAEGYLNWGRGFHSNDVRGATIAVDPVTEETADRVDVLVSSEGAEAGVRVESGGRFNTSLVLFWLEIDSELVFVGDAGATEPNGATERTGIELSAFWQATRWLALDAAYTATDARFEQDQGGGRAVPGAVESTFSVGLNAAWANGLSASARMRYLGEAPLLEDDSVRTDDSLLVNVGMAYRLANLELGLDVFNLLDSNDHDISYFYASRLTGEPAEGVEDVHFHPLEPRTLRASMTYHW